MKKQKYKKPLVSIVIANYNNAKLCIRSISSIIAQTYKNIEIVVIDDNSKDDSIKILNRYKNKIVLIKNRKKTGIAGYDQMNAYKKAFLKSKGSIIFFLDSEKKKKKNKVNFIVEYFKKNKKTNLIFDQPIIFFNKKKFYKKKFKKSINYLTNIPRFTPQSCISIRRSYLKKILNKILIRKFPTLWLDFRIAVYSYLLSKNLTVLDNHFTFYQQSQNSISAKYKKFSKSWWIRRDEANKFISHFSKNFKYKNNIKIDIIVTKLISLFIKN